MELSAALDPTVIVTVLCASILLGFILAIPLVWQSLKGNLNATLCRRVAWWNDDAFRASVAPWVDRCADCARICTLVGTGLLGVSFKPSIVGRSRTSLQKTF